MSEAGEYEPREEPLHPGWQSLAGTLGATNELFEKTLWLLGYGFSSNIYVIRGEYLTIIDPGNDYTAFIDLFALGVEPAAVNKIVATHGHHDHVMGAFEILRSYPSLLESGGYELILHEAGPQELKEMAKGFGCRVSELKGGETVELSGLEWEAVHTPGHTIDGLCLYHAPTRTLVTGDTVMPHAMGAPDPKAGGNLDHYLFSIRSLLKKDIENVLPGHGGPIAGDGRRAVEETYEGLIIKTLDVDVKDDAGVPWFQCASELAQKGLLEESVFCCGRELSANPDHLGALQLKALCLNDLGRCDEAVEILDKILERRGDDVFALVGKGYGLLGSERYAEAIGCFDQALDLDPHVKEAKIYKGMALYLSGRYQEALDIGEFQAEFMERFKDELEKEGGPPDESEGRDPS